MSFTTTDEMNISALVILTLVLCVLALASCFVRRVSASLIAYGAMVCAHCVHAAAIGTYELVFWGIATAIILGLRWLRDGDHWRRAALAYTAGGAAVGAFLGAVVAPTQSAIIAGSALGSFLGALAYMRTPSSPHVPVGSRVFVEYLAAKSLPAIIACSMVAITTVAVVR